MSNSLEHCNLGEVKLCLKVTLSFTPPKQLVLPLLPATFLLVTRRLQRPKQLVLLRDAWCNFKTKLHLCNALIQCKIQRK